LRKTAEKLSEDTLKQGSDFNRIIADRYHFTDLLDDCREDGRIVYRMSHKFGALGELGYLAKYGKM
jgi:hypothetical protein